MKVLVLSTMVPFVHGGAEELCDHLVGNLRLAGVDAEAFRIPFTWNPADRLIDEMVIARTLRLDNVDRVIAPEVSRLHGALARQGTVAAAPVPSGLRSARCRPEQHRGRRARPADRRGDPGRRHARLRRGQADLHQRADNRPAAATLQRRRQHSIAAAAERPGAVRRRRGGGLRAGHRPDQRRQAAASAGRGAAPRAPASASSSRGRRIRRRTASDCAALP